MMPVVLLGVGNAWRGDDAIGLVVARRVAERVAATASPPRVEVLESDGDPAALLEAWDGAALAVVVDAVSSGAKPGTVHCLEAGDGPLPATLRRSSTHVLGIAEAVELARALGRLPGRLVVVGVEGAGFAAGAGLSPAVEDVVEAAVQAVWEEVETCTSTA